MFRNIYDEKTERLPHRHTTADEVIELIYTYPKSTKREDIIDWLINTCFIENYAIKLSSNDNKYLDDIIQDIYVDILSISQEKWDTITYQGFAAIRAYISGMIHRQIKSVTSPTYYKYKKRKLVERNISSTAWNVYEETNKMPDNEEQI